MLTRFAHNPRYLTYNDKPTVLLASGEHYGAVLNLDFDYKTYLKTIAGDGMNLTRTFSGTYRELPGEFNIENNTLAPEFGRFICPFKRIVGADGTEKFDLSSYDDAYFDRLTSFLKEADRLGIVVELVLFCFWYNPSLWEHSLLHPLKNVQGVGPQARERAYDLENNNLLPYLEDLVRTLVTHLNTCGNVYYEIINEPYSRQDHDDDDDFHRHISALIVETEKKLPNKHMIARNYANRVRRIDNPDPNIDIANFHYTLPEAVAWNWHLGLVLSDDETGFAGQLAKPYRIEAWRFFLSGGGIFSHLDYSFTTKHPDGTAPILGKTPGYGGTDLRKQFAYLKKFTDEIKVWELAPHPELFPWDAGDVRAYALSDLDKRYAVYVYGGGTDGSVALSLPKGEYQVKWLSPAECKTREETTVNHPGDYLRLKAPSFTEDIALLVTRK